MGGPILDLKEADPKSTVELSENRSLSRTVPDSRVTPLDESEDILWWVCCEGVELESEGQKRIDRPLLHLMPTHCGTGDANERN